MLRFIAHRLGQSLIVLLGTTIMVFILVRVLPGDPVDLLFAGEGGTAEQRQDHTHRLGLDRPLPVQYLIFLGQVVRGQMGESLSQGLSVNQLLWDGLGASFELTMAGMLIAVLIAVPVGLVSALRQNSFWDRAGTISSLFGVSMPTFWQGIMLILFLSVAFPLFPASGVIAADVPLERITRIPILDALLTGNLEAFQSTALHLVLPAVTLGTTSAAILARLLRANLLEVKNQEFVDGLRARGLPEWRVVIHALRNAIPTTVIVFGSKLGTLLGGTLVIEVVFGWPGLGWLLVRAISARDYPVIQGAVLLATILVVLSNLLADIAHGWLDPRVKHSRTVNA